MAWPQGASIGELSGPWWVAHTRSRFEKALAEELLRKEVGYFLPMVQRVTFSGGRKRRGLMPLFASYLFFCGDADARQAVLATNRVCQIIPVADREKLVRELVAIERAIAHQGALDLYPFAAVGQQCRVKAGPLLGLSGVVVRRDQESRFVLSVSILGQGAILEIDADALEPMG